jgi:hypothetical protein
MTLTLAPGCAGPLAKILKNRNPHEYQYLTNLAIFQETDY